MTGCACNLDTINTNLCMPVFLKKFVARNWLMTLKR